MLMASVLLSLQGRAAAAAALGLVFFLSFSSLMEVKYCDLVSLFLLDLLYHPRLICLLFWPLPTLKLIFSSIYFKTHCK